ncbi:hypothetical protein [Herbaspirillum sp. VT-16-41]|uniref:hypothetical protein n=1 Tax=Herbaspirillum sp. VT-16-41 TaxID=1953765 RepID=UPI001115751E|nr:hypothetical protein [Herbaspirillum sp. VT-16-41]
MPTIAGCTVTLTCGTVVNGQVRHLLGIVIDIGMFFHRCPAAIRRLHEKKAGIPQKLSFYSFPALPLP